jgi:UDP-glucose 4-epimerase
MLKNILVTGGAGFIGSHLVERLVKIGYQVKILDNLSSGSLSNIGKPLDSGRVQFINGDIRNVRIVDSCVQGVDAIIHLAAQISVPLSIQNPEHNNQVNIKGTKNLLDASVTANLAKFLFISSCAVYGDPRYFPVDEGHATQPISPYAQSKLIGEQNCLRLNNADLLEAVVLRFFNVYGPRQGLNDYSGVMTKFIERIMQKQPPKVYGDGSQTRDFVYVKDIVQAIVLALESSKAKGEVFNVGTGKATTIKELAQTLLILAGANPTIEYAPERQGDIKYSYANINKARSLLHYEPSFPLDTGLRTLLKENGL